MRESRDQHAENGRETTRLYLITPPALDPERFAKELEEALAGGDVACLQLRLKDCDDDVIRHATRMLKPIAHFGKDAVEILGLAARAYTALAAASSRFALCPDCVSRNCRGSA